MEKDTDKGHEGAVDKHAAATCGGWQQVETLAGEDCCYSCIVLELSTTHVVKMVKRPSERCPVRNSS